MKAAFAAGCFWGVQESFTKIKGISSTTVGYMGGKTKNPSYKEVCTGKTNHAEMVLLSYNPKKVSYEVLLETFWKIHNPTTKNRQGLNIGTQYRSIIFYFTEKQKALATKSKKLQEIKIGKKIVTEIKKAGIFYKAEDYHQEYYKKNGRVC